MICVSRAVSTAALRLALAGACLVPTMAATVAPAAAQTVAKAPAVPTEPLTIATQGGPKRFAVEQVGEVGVDEGGRFTGVDELSFVEPCYPVADVLH